MKPLSSRWQKMVDYVLGAAPIMGAMDISISSDGNAELLLVDVLL